MKTYTILGGGIAGLTTAIALKKIGIRALVLEAAPEIRPVGAGLMLAANAVKAYQHLGIDDKIIPRGRQLTQFNIFDQWGRTLASTDAAAVSERYGLHNFAIHRAALHEALIAELDPEQIQTGRRATGYSLHENGSIDLSFADGSVHQTDYLIVADGIHSAIRRQILPESQPRYAGYTCWRAVIDNPGLALSAASETWGAAGRVGIVPLPDNKIYCFICVNAPQNDPQMRAFKSNDLQRVFAGFHEPIPTLLAHFQDADLIWNDIADLKPIPRFAFGPIVLMGDAAHATTPNLGQGACQAIEDAVVLADELRKQTDPQKAFKAFEQRRLKRTHGIVNTSWQMGKIAQWQHPWLIAVRNALFRLIPESANERQLRNLLEVDF